LDEIVVGRTIMFFELRGQKASLANEHAARAEFVRKVFVLGNGSYNFGGVNVTALPSVGQQSPIIKGNRFYSTILVRVTVPLDDGRIRDARLAQRPMAQTPD
jgi:outer membrane protein